MHICLNSWIFITNYQFRIFPDALSRFFPRLFPDLSHSYTRKAVIFIVKPQFSRIFRFFTQKTQLCEAWVCESVCVCMSLSVCGCVCVFMWMCLCVCVCICVHCDQTSQNAQCVAMCCSMLQYVAVCCNVLLCVDQSKRTVCCSVLHGELQWVAAYRLIKPHCLLQCVAVCDTVCCSALQCIDQSKHTESHWLKGTDCLLVG